MNGSRPKPPNSSGGKPPNLPKSRAKSRKPRRAKPSVPWAAMGALLVVYLLIGLLMSIPTPPYWVWIAIALAIPLLVFGLNRPVITGGKRDWGGLMAYVGGLVMAVALAVSANYIGSENSFDEVPFLMAILGLAVLTLLAVFLTAIAAILSAQSGTQLMASASYGRSVSMVVVTSFMGLCLGGVVGLAITTITATA